MSDPKPLELTHYMVKLFHSGLEIPSREAIIALSRYWLEQHGEKDPDLA